MTQSDQSAIHFNNVSYSVNDVHILKEISGSILEGKITTLVGPSGSGKTSLLKLCNGLISPTSGDVFILNKPITSYDPVQLRRLVGMALQNAPMIKRSVYDNLKLPLTLQNKELSEEEAIVALERVGLEKRFLHHQSEDLSGGQRQKVSIARTLINRSQILLLDEITSALDQTSVQEIESLILKINQEYGVTIVWITHNLDQAKAIGDYTWVMMEGKVVETGTIDILNSPSNDLVRGFVTGGRL